MPTPAENEAYWRKKLGNQGSISKPKRTLGDLVEQGIAKGLEKAGSDPRNAHRRARRLSSFINDATPVGNATGADQGARDFARGVTKGDLGQSALGAAVFGLSVAPFPGKGAARRKLSDLMQDESGAIRAYHGGTAHSGNFDLDHAGTGLGYADEPAVWFTPDQFEANRYAWSVGGGPLNKNRPASGSYYGKAVYPATIDDVGFDDLPPMDYDPEEFARIIAEARKAGRPGVIFRAVREDDRLSRPVDQIAVLDPSRIKF